ncbi:Uncharacterised protein [Bordetella pertussis]|nr:Uncharacterised protein [Bordetella pertussis]
MRPSDLPAHGASWACAVLVYQTRRRGRGENPARFDPPRGRPSGWAVSWGEKKTARKRLINPVAVNPAG